MRWVYVALGLLAAPAAAEPLDWSWWAEGRPAVAEILNGYAQACAAEEGALELYGTEERAFVETDLDADGALDDLVIDMGQIVCSRALTLWAGTGGSPIHFVLDGTVAASWSGHLWEVERLGATYGAVILIARHGTACDGAGVDPCVQAIVAHEGRFFTVRYPQSNEEPG